MGAGSTNKKPVNRTINIVWYTGGTTEWFITNVKHYQPEACKKCAFMWHRDSLCSIVIE